MAEPVPNKAEEEDDDEAECTVKMEGLLQIMSRKEKRKAKKKMKRKQIRKEMAEKEREEEEARLNDPEEQRREGVMEEEEKERKERERKQFEDRERAWIEAMEKKNKEEEERRMALEEEKSKRLQGENENEFNEDDDWEYVEEGPAEIIWQGNEIIVKKKRVRVPKKDANQQSRQENADRPTSNPLPPQSEAFSSYKNASSAEHILKNVSQQVPNFGTEQDKAHCPFHLKTGACRFGLRCSRVHFYPDKSFTLLIRNMYNGPGLAWEQDEGLEYTDEEVERCYEEFYEDVHTEFLKFGEIVNFKVCRNGSFHLRGNVYIQYKSLDSAALAYHSSNGRYFAGKQVSCEFVNLTRWKVAICGEYMKSRFKTCSHGTACNFIHCFRNPGGDYEWADCDKPPPKYWVKKMTALFGYYDEAGHEKQVEQENLGHRRHSSKMMTDVDRSCSRRSKSREMDFLNSSSCSGRNGSGNDVPKSTRWRQYASDDRKQMKVLGEDMYEENTNLKETNHMKSRTHDTDSDGEWLDKDGDKERYRDRYHGSASKSSRSQNGDKKHRSCGDESKGDWSDSEDRETHNRHARKRSRHSREARLLDDCEDQENRRREWSKRDGDRETYHGQMTKSARHHRKVKYPDDHWDSKNRTHDTGVDWSDGERDRDRDRDRDRHHRKRRKSSRHQRKVERRDDHGDSKNGNHEGEWLDRDSNSDREQSRRQKGSEQDSISDDHGDSTSRADDTGFMND
ncbi:hypothetical protein F2P56_028657 [Juglans regia]|uniref:Zinc finger CCCH domain-containing protein 5 n=2 Tax=Juglans regia TaxID=51240 RepID=A0A2I4EEM4_JUGRE|nr:zinc finger CCCH domain-containing protein 5 [Juglans regia]KAF5448092.1 hypothetical protein F2P56_028657 [Juglans regia]